jgi:hypothetical protein
MLVSHKDVTTVLTVFTHHVAIIITIVALHTISPLNLVSNFVSLVFGALRQHGTGRPSQAQHYDESHPKCFGHKSPSTVSESILTPPQANTSNESAMKELQAGNCRVKQVEITRALEKLHQRHEA